MVTLVSVLTLVSTIGTSIQSFFSWAGYNRDSFGINVGWRQSHLYQSKNYHMNSGSFAREDLKDLKDVSVHHTSNYLMVSTLVLSSTVLAFAVAGFNASCPAFVVFAFYTSAATSVVFLSLAINFGMRSQGSAYENTVSLLTRHLRPHTPSPFHHYMAQAHFVESLGLGSLLRRPGAPDGYGLKVERSLSDDGGRLRRFG